MVSRSAENADTGLQYTGSRTRLSQFPGYAKAKREGRPFNTGKWMLFNSSIKNN
jgi:hypothetical protein